MADLHLCTCSSGPHADAPRLLPPGCLVVMTDPGDRTLTGSEVAEAMGKWADDNGTLVVLLHHGVTLESLTADQLASIGLARTSVDT